jgi:hypothetical protein
MKIFLLSALLAVVLMSAACSATPPSPPPQPPEPVAAKPSPQSTGIAELQLSERTDQQGAVALIVRPAYWKAGNETIDFEVLMDTHSIDLNFDLAVLSTLTTDTGLTARAIRWDSPGGRHHLSGVLAFPAQVEGKDLFDGISKLTLTIEDVDAPERVFTWELSR